MQRKHTQHGCWQPKPVRPVSETGQTAFVGLSLTQAGETGQTGLAIWLDQFCPEPPQKSKTLQEPFHIRTKEAMAQQRLPCSKTLLDSPQGETGQTGFCLDSREEHSPREKLNTSTNRSFDLFHGSK
jgi:hypothetical protein